MKTKQRIMAVDIQPGGFFYIINQMDARGNSKQLARGHVKTRGWLTRKARQFKVKNIIHDDSIKQIGEVIHKFKRGEVGRTWTPEISKQTHASDTEKMFEEHRRRSKDLHGF